MRWGELMVVKSEASKRINRHPPITATTEKWKAKQRKYDDESK